MWQIWVNVVLGVAFGIVAIETIKNKPWLGILYALCSGMAFGYMVIRILRLFQ